MNHRHARPTRIEDHSNRITRWLWAAVVIGSAAVPTGQAAEATDTDSRDDQPLPPFSQVRGVVDRHFGVITDYRPGDIVSQSDVAPLFDAIRGLGWNVTDRKAILGHVPKDRDFVVRRLRTDAGRRFMRKIAKMPMAYDRLYRLVALPRGRQMLVDLIDSKGGDQMIQYLTSSPGGKNLGTMLQQAPRGTDFNQPVGLLFTADQLASRLKQSYDQDRRRRAESLAPLR